MLSNGGMVTFAPIVVRVLKKPTRIGRMEAIQPHNGELIEQYKELSGMVPWYASPANSAEVQYLSRRITTITISPLKYTGSVITIT